MIEKIEGVENQLIPHTGFTKGWNIIIYNNSMHSMNDVVALLMNGGLTEMEGNLVASLASQKGFFAIPYQNEKEKAEKMNKELNRGGLQNELIFEE